MPGRSTKRFIPAYSVGDFVASVLQLVVTGVEGEGLHDVGSCPQKLPVQLSHFKSDRLDHEKNTLIDPVSRQGKK